MGVRRPAPFVGRDKELGALRAAISSAMEERPEIVVIRGEAGIGKSRLLSEAMARYAVDDVLVVWAHGVAGIPAHIETFDVPCFTTPTHWNSSIDGPIPTCTRARRH